MSIHLREPERHDIARAAVIDADAVACSLIAFVEVRSGLARARFKDNPARLDGDGYSKVLADFQTDWRTYFRIRMSDRLIRQAADLAEKHRLRAYDAIHLASALAVRERVPDRILVSTWDRELADAARAEGLDLAHEVTP